MKSVLFFWLFCLATPALTAQTASLPDTCPTFIRYWGRAGEYERGIALCPAGDGNLYLTGSKPDSAVLLKMSPDGDILWARSFDFLPGYDNITRLVADSDGNLLGSVYGCNCLLGATHTAFFKYDPIKDVMLWKIRPEYFTTFGGLTAGIIEKQPGGNYWIGFSSGIPPGNAVIMEIDRTTGESIPGSAWRYQWGMPSSQTLFQNLLRHGPHLYAAGYWSDPGGNRRQALVCIDTATGQPIWRQLSPIPLGQKAGLYAEQILVDQDTLVSVGWGADAGTAPQLPNSIFLQKTSLQGELLWLKKYDLGGFQKERAFQIIRVSDGYVVFGGAQTATYSEDNLFLFKTDLNGNVLWARKYDYSPNDNLYGAAVERTMMEMNGFLYFTGYSADDMGASDWLLAKLDANGRASDPCLYLEDIPVETTLVADPVQEMPPLEFQAADLEYSTQYAPPEGTPTALPVSETLCERSCANTEACDTKTNACVTFELLDIKIDAAGDRYYRIRFTNNCTGQTLRYLAVQLPQGTKAVWPDEGANYLSPDGRHYTVRNPNSSPFHSIRYLAQGNGLLPGQSDVFEYALIAQAQPDYIQVFARLTPGPSYEAHLNVFHCPVGFRQGLPDFSTAQAGFVSLAPNPVTDHLNVTFDQSGSGRWQILNLCANVSRSGQWQNAIQLSLPVSDLPPGVYVLRLTDVLGRTDVRRFVKTE